MDAVRSGEPVEDGGDTDGRPGARAIEDILAEEEGMERKVLVRARRKGPAREAGNRKRRWEPVRGKTNPSERIPMNPAPYPWG